MKTKEVYILQHEEIVEPGNIINILDEFSINYSIFRIDLNQKPSINNRPDLLIVLGGTMDTCDEEKFDWMRWEKNFLKSQIENGMPIYGICLGGQLLAEALGAKIPLLASIEIGWHNIHITLNDEDKLKYFNKKIDKIPLFTFHKYYFEKPPKAKRLGFSKACPNHGFIYNDKIIGVQFHPEVTPELLKKWSENFFDNSKPHHKEMNDILETQLNNTGLFDNQKLLNRQIIQYLITQKQSD